MTELARDLDQEHTIGRQIVKGRSLSRAWDLLVKLADERAHPGPILLPPGRSLVREALEELADLRNYVLWAVRAGTLRPITAAKICGHIAAIAVLLAGADG